SGFIVDIESIDIHVDRAGFPSCRPPARRTMTQAASTPIDLTIRPRDLSFGRDTAGDRWWLAGDPVATAFYNALSSTFPLGERFFMDSVRRFRNDVAP